MYVEYGIPQDIDLWMALVEEVRWNFPGLETQEKLNEHRATVLKFMGKRQAKQYLATDSAKYRVHLYSVHLRIFN